MTITLAPQTEARLRQKAAREGRDPATLAAFLLDDLLEQESEAVSVANTINHALRAAEQGQEKTLSVYLAEQRQKRGHSEEWPSRHSAMETAPGVFDAVSE